MSKGTTKIITMSPPRLGDTVMTTAYFPLFKEIFGEVEIDVIVQHDYLTEVYEGNPLIHKTMSIPSDEELNQIKDNYDYAINAHRTPKSQELLQKFNAKYIEEPDIPSNLHKVENFLRYFSSLFHAAITDHHRQYYLYPTEKNISKIKSLLHINAPTENKPFFVGIHLGCYGLSKRKFRLFNKFKHERVWPTKNYITLAKMIQQYYSSVCFVITGSKSEEKLGDVFCKKIKNTLNLIGKTSVLDVAALMGFLSVFVSNNTGPLHVASATPVNLVTLFEPRFVINSPYPLIESRIMIVNDHLAEITVDEVFSAIKKLIGQTVC